jgi:hypothetical protein
MPINTRMNEACGLDIDCLNQGRLTFGGWHPEVEPDFVFCAGVLWEIAGLTHWAILYNNIALAPNADFIRSDRQRAVCLGIKGEIQTLPESLPSVNP